MSIILDTYYNITEIQANYYDKVATDSLFSNIDLSNYSSKIEVDDIDNELFTLILNTYTKTEIDTQLTDYATISYLQSNYMTTLSITEALMNNYASISLLDGNFYDKAYLDNQFSLKADVSELTSLVTTDYLELKYTNSVDLTIDYYKKTDIDNMLLSYSTGSYVDYNLANKVSTTGDASISGNLDVGEVLILQRITGVTDTPPLKINNSSNNGWTVGQFESTLNNIGCLVEYKTFASSTSWWTGVWGTNTNEFKV